MGEKEDAGEPEVWSDLEWQTPGEELDDVLVPVENDEEVDPLGVVQTRSSRPNG